MPLRASSQGGQALPGVAVVGVVGALLVAIYYLSYEVKVRAQHERGLADALARAERNLLAQGAQQHLPQPPPPGWAAVAAAAPSGGGCPSFGTAPGVWTSPLARDGPGTEWVALDPRCRTVDYWSLLLNGTASAADGASVLLIGDSLDKYIVRDFLKASGENLQARHRWTFNDPANKGKCCSYPNEQWLSQQTKADIGSMWIFGMSQEGPYYVQDTFLKSELPIETPARIAAAGEKFAAKARAPAGLVALRGQFWDLARMHQRDRPALKRLWDGDKGGLVASAWMANASAAAAAARRAFPGARLAIFTTPCPKENQGGFGKGYHYRRYVGALNAAARRLAEEEGMILVDVDAMALQLTVEERTFDGKHPNVHLNRATLNILLNEYVSQGMGVALPAQAQVQAQVQARAAQAQAQE